MGNAGFGQHLLGEDNISNQLARGHAWPWQWQAVVKLAIAGTTSHRANNIRYVIGNGVGVLAA